ncbi:MAG: FtsX-like permease family protein [Bryobacteraceae bacterium]
MPVIGLVLAAIGIFGVMSYRVAQRTHEIGVRMAWGAQGEDVLRMVLAEGLRTAAVGLALGRAGAWALTRYLASLLYSVKPSDPLTLGLVSMLALGTEAAACYLPPRRALRLDPRVALWSRGSCHLLCLTCRTSAAAQSSSRARR